MYLFVDKTSVALLSVLPVDVTAVDDGGEVVGAALLPLPDTLGLLGLALTTLDVHTGLVAQHQLRRVWKYINLIIGLRDFLCWLFVSFCRYFVRVSLLY